MGGGGLSLNWDGIMFSAKTSTLLHVVSALWLWYVHLGTFGDIPYVCLYMGCTKGHTFLEGELWLPASYSLIFRVADLTVNYLTAVSPDKTGLVKCGDWTLLEHSFSRVHRVTSVSAKHQSPLSELWASSILARRLFRVYSCRVSRAPWWL
jgi:hypothetical protein